MTMKVIGIDTTTRTFCMALIRDEKVLERLIVHENEYCTENLICYLQEILKRRSLRKDDIDGYAVSIGPGSLTGIRVGLAFCKGLGFATGKPVVGISTLRAIACKSNEKAACVCPVLLTKRDRLFWALYLFAPEQRTLQEPSCSTVEEFLQKLPKRKIRFLGTGALKFRSMIEQKMGEKACFEEEDVFHADPAIVAMLGEKHIERGDVPLLDTLEPIYL
jgi:tRNA threonylcarbamoyladenosine biosynthesis protein TsaB